MIEGITPAQVEAIRFIEEEFKIYEVIEQHVNTKTTAEINEITEPIFVKIVEELSKTFDIPLSEGVELYLKYVDFMSVVAQLSMLEE